MSYLVNALKNITKEYYEDYIKKLSKIIKKEETPNYIAKDIFNFVKKFVKNTKENFDLDSFIQNISNDGESFYNLIIEMMDKVSDTSENVIESIRNIFIGKNLLKNSQKIAEDGGEEEEEKEEEEEEKDEENDLDEIKEENIEKSHDKKDNATKDYIYLIKGDVIIEEKINAKKGKKKKSSIEKNMLDELDI